MSSVFIEAFGRAASEAEVSRLENELGTRLPDDYRSFLLTTNGGKPTPAVLLIPDLGEETILGALYGIGRVKSHFDIDFWRREWSDELPPGHLAIGGDRGGGFILFDAMSGSVYYWDHQHFFSSSSVEGNTYPVANSFAEFLASLHELRADTG